MDNILEEWRPVVGWEGLYEVSNYGRVRSIDRYIPYKGIYGKMRLCRGKIIVPCYCRGGYLRILLYSGSKSTRKLMFVHRLVAFSFPEICGEYFEGAHVNHKDENPENNAAWNLEWCTPNYNINYGTRNNRVSKAIKNRPDISKPVLCVDTGEIYPSSAEAERSKNGKVSGIIRRVLNPKTKNKTAYGFKWRYA